MSTRGALVHFDFLAERLGPTLTAFLAQADDANGRGADPHRLQSACLAWDALVEMHTEHIARSWFIAANPYLGDSAPVETLRQGNTGAVVIAAMIFASDEVMDG